MKNIFNSSKNGASKIVLCLVAISLAACTGTNDEEVVYAPIATPTVDYVETLDVYSAPHQDSFLNQLAMNYRSYAIYNARTSGYSEMGELFAQKAVAAFSGELPYPESLENWPVEDEQTAFELYTAYNALMDQLKNDASYTNPQLAAEAQAKYDCWLSATASGQWGTAEECKARFEKTMVALEECTNGSVSSNCNQGATKTFVEEVKVSGNNTTKEEVVTYYSDSRSMKAMNAANRAAREGVIIVNSVNVPEHLINPVPVQPMVFNQNIKYVGGNTELCVNGTEPACQPKPAVKPEPKEEIPMVGDEVVSRQEFINMMMAMREELAAINARLDRIEAAAGEKTLIKVQQIPLEPKQHVMEEILEIRFDFDKSTIKPEYEELIRQLATATQNNKNIKVSVVGHTDTMGSKNYNYALGGRRAEAVQRMLIKYGIPSSQIVAVSAGEEDLKVPTPDGVANAENRRVRVVKEVHYTEPAKQVPIAVVEEYTTERACGEYGCQE